jgi:hypothetical protein
MRVEDGGLIYDAANQPAERRVACFVALCPLRNGAMLCCFQVGPRKHAPTGTLGLCRSDDGGRTWHEVPLKLETAVNGVRGSLAAGEMVEVGPGRLLLFATWFDRSDPDQPLFDPESGGILPSRQLLAESREEGRSWSAWRELPTAGLRGCALTGPVLHWPDGAIGVAFESYKEYGDPRPGRHAAWLMISRDHGATFGPPLLVAQHPEHAVYYWDQRLAVGPGPGELVALFWTHDLVRKRDLTVHFRRAWLTDLEVPSETSGISPILSTPIAGQIAAPLVLDDGRLLAFVVDRGKPATMTLWQSPDGGLTWPRQEALTIYAHDERAALSQTSGPIDFKQYWEDMGKWSFGHPAIRPIGPGRVLVAWYAGTPDAMSVHWARLRVG